MFLFAASHANEVLGVPTVCQALTGLLEKPVDFLPTSQRVVTMLLN